MGKYINGQYYPDEGVGSKTGNAASHELNKNTFNMTSEELCDYYRQRNAEIEAKEARKKKREEEAYGKGC